MNSFKKIAIAGAAALALVATSVSVASAATPQSTSISAKGIARAGGAFYVQATLTSNVLSGNGTDTIYTLMTSAPSGVTLPAGPESHTANAPWINGTLVDTNTVNLVGLSSSNGGVTAVLPGTYTFLVWADSGTVGSANVPQLGDAVTNISVVAGSAPSSMVFSSTSLTGATRTYIPTNITVKDSAGILTLLNPYETIIAQPSAGSVSTSSIGSDSRTVGASLWIDNTKQAKDGSIKVYLENDNAGVASTTFSGSGFLSGGLIPSASVTINTFNTVNATGVGFSSNQTGILVNSALPTGTYTGSNTVSASTTNVNTKSLTFNVTGGSANAGGIILATVSQTTGVVLPNGVVSGTTQITLDASGNAVFSVATANGGVSGTGYTLNIAGVTFVVTYATPLPVSSKFTLSPNAQSSTGTTSITTAFGTTTKISATVLDQFGDVSQGSLVTFSLSGSSNRNGSNTVIAVVVTDSNGVASTNFTDTASNTNTLNADDHITASLVYPGSVGTVNPNAAKSYVNIHYVANLAVSKVNVSYTSGATSSTSAIDNSVTYTVSVLDSTGATLSGIPVNYTVSNGYVSGLQSGTTYTSAGSASIVVKGTNAGKITLTATAGNVTGSESTITVINSTSDARTIALDASSYSVTTGGLKRVKAIVKDRYGNPVAGQTVTFATTIGRFAGNSLSVTGLTDVDGIALADLAPLVADSAGTGTLTATFANGDTSTATTLVANSGSYPVAVSSVKSSVVVTTATSTSDIATAQKATDAKIAELNTSVINLTNLVTSLISQIKTMQDNAKAAQDLADAKYKALIAKYNALAKKFKQPTIK